MKTYKFDMWSAKDLGPKGGKTTKHYMKISISNEGGPTITYSTYAFNKYDDVISKYNKMVDRIPGGKINLVLKNPKWKIVVNDYLMHNAWYEKPVYTDRKPYPWVIKSKKFAEKMMKEVA